jgi:bifunctional non-homologous end joining protein LigD
MCPAKRSRPRREPVPGADDSLAEYRRKRDFERTREPAGGAARAPRGRLRFVIQKHAASSLHYDLRLELDGVMRSWAVPKGPSLDPSAKRLAMQVEDHPIEYNTFEGTIPKGEYGGGTVMLWDRGTYHPDEAADGESDADAVRRGLRAGKLSFTLEGERLRGSFALVRTERGEKPKWLLIKHRDDSADADADITAAVLTSVESGRTMDEIAAGADRVWRSNRGGAKGGAERAPAKKKAELVIAPMQPTPARSVPDGAGWRFEPWYGGERVLAYVTPGAARLAGEDGRDVGAHRDIAGQLGALSRRVGHAFVLDGELVERDGDVTLHVSDLLLEDDDVLMQRPWQARRRALEKLFARRRVKGVRVQRVLDDAADVLAEAHREGWAGVIAHRGAGSYQPGARSPDVLRIAVH